MRALRRSVVCLCVLASLAAPAGVSAGSSLFVGAVENAPLTPDVTEAKAKMDLAQLAGFDALRIAVFWGRGRSFNIPHGDLLAVQNAATAAQLDGIRLIVSVSNLQNRDTPNTANYRWEFSQYCAALARALPSVTDFIIGNEPNLNSFWMPQFTSKGADAAAPAYEALLALTYDTLKAVNPEINVIGVALSPHGADKPKGKRPTHSPTAFILDLGKAMRATHRTKPLMDAFAIHPYGDTSKQPPTFSHGATTSIGFADYAKLTKTLTQAFKGTAQPGATLPIVYDEYGVQTTIPSAKAHVYSNLGTTAAADAVSEKVQASYYRQAITMAYCQPNVVGLLFFHVSDESNANFWQSGVFYANDTPKSSLAAVRAAAMSARAATLSSCASASTTNFLQSVTFTSRTSYLVDDTTWGGEVRCSKPCSYESRIERYPSGVPVLKTQADVAPYSATAIAFPSQTLAVGSYRMVTRVWAYGKVGTTLVRYGTPFTVK